LSLVRIRVEYAILIGRSAAAIIDGAPGWIIRRLRRLTLRASAAGAALFERAARIRRTKLVYCRWFEFESNMPFI
jgi:hypothetical protein